MTQPKDRLRINVEPVAPGPTRIEVTDREAKWMRRNHRQRLLTDAQKRVSNGRLKGFRRTQLSVESFAEIVELALKGLEET